MSDGQVTDAARLKSNTDEDANRQMIGYLYQHTPIELFIAHGFTPKLVTAIKGVMGGFESSLQTFSCAYSRNIFSQRASGKLGELTGIVFPGNTCDSLQNMGDVWRYRFPDDRVFRLTYPAGLVNDDAIAFFAAELDLLNKELQRLYGFSPTNAQFREAIELVNMWRLAIQQLYTIRLVHPELISYLQLASLIDTFYNHPCHEKATEAKEITHNLAIEMKDESALSLEQAHRALLTGNFWKQKLTTNASPPRLVVVGGMISPSTIANLFDSVSNTHPHELVMDLLSLGFKTIFTPPCNTNGEWSVELAKSILSAPLEPTQEGLPKRIEYVKNLFTAIDVDGIIICEQSFCDPDQFEAPSLKGAANQLGIKALRLPLDPELSDEQRIITRIQSFLETIGGV
ncbi:MAG: hypothetical protein BAJATHORv1_110012 [Candidatus Thorarchaeota archaeon]|nr:MAG: hypothetical protein BAJATHORv1_110012 [Candidatus Thorarchaeota archaeon]